MHRPVIGGIAAAIVIGSALVALAVAPAGVPAATGDCEMWRTGTIGQPAGAWSSLGLGAAAVWIAATARQRAVDGVVALAAAASGGGALLFHAGGATWAGRLDGFGVAAVTVSLAVAAWTDRAFPAAAAAALVAGVAVAVPDVLAGVAAGCGALAAVTVLLRAPRPRLAVAALVCLAVGGALWWLGRTGGPWCDPARALQPHAGWHLLAAGAVAAAVAAMRHGTGPGGLYAERRSTSGGERPNDATA